MTFISNLRKSINSSQSISQGERKILIDQIEELKNY